MSTSAKIISSVYYPTAEQKECRDQKDHQKDHQKEQTVHQKEQTVHQKEQQMDHQKDHQKAQQTEQQPEPCPLYPTPSHLVHHRPNKSVT